MIKTVKKGFARVLLPFKKIENKLIKGEQETSKTKQNNTWHYFNSQSDTVIVFVHGILSNSKKCWTSKSGSFWPDIVCNDRRFASPSIFLGGYHTALDSNEYKLRDCAEELMNALERDGADGAPSPMSFNKILFVCHSMGGNVVRYALTSRTSRFATKQVGLLLMASPSMGSEYADTFSGLISFFKNKMAAQLERMSETLEDLDNRFKAIIDDESISNLVGIEGVENHSLLKFRFLEMASPVVKKESAVRYFAHHQILPGTDHSTIVKPSNHEAASHIFLYDFYKKKFCGIGGGRVHNSAAQDNRGSKISGETGLSRKRDALFDVYTPACSEYYEERNIDLEVHHALSMCSVWLSGPSGFGKTSVLRRYLYDKGLKPVEVCLSYCDGKLDQQKLLSEIANNLFQARGERRKDSKVSFPEVAKLLADYSRQSLVILYLDEIPMSDEDGGEIEEFSITISNLLDATKRYVATQDVRFVLSSIVEPQFPKHGSTKFTEHIRSLKIAKWTNEDLEKLLDRILPHIGVNNFSDDERLSLIRESNGSPRFLKIYLRSRAAYTEKDPGEILEMAKSQHIS